MLRTDFAQPIDIDRETTPAGIIARMEHILDRMEPERDEQRRRASEAATRLAGYEPRLGETFPLQSELDDRLTRVAEIEADLARTEGVTGETVQPQRGAALIRRPRGRCTVAPSTRTRPCGNGPGGSPC